jgi:CubicO group peptidase (beta-lactamase class C family)
LCSEQEITAYSKSSFFVAVTDLPMASFVTRRDVAKWLGATMIADALPPQQTIARTALAATTPESVGFAADLPKRFETLLVSGRLRNVHGVVALRKGRIFFERYFTGTDEVWGRPLGTVEFNRDTLHDMRSVTKSVVGLLYGIALGQGLVPAPDQSLLAQFPEFPDLARDANKARLTIAHALTMTLALEWNDAAPWENVPTEVAMERSPDRYRFILERAMLGAPGKSWIYCGGAAALLGRLIERGAGIDLHAFATTALFEPLGIGSSEWSKGRDGVPSAASGLRLAPCDLACIGQMILDGGKWAERTIVPASWLDESFRPAAIADDAEHYGYLWYLGEFAVPTKIGVYGAKWMGAAGLGGQRLFIFPDLEFVLAITAGNYATLDYWKLPFAIVREVFLASLDA